MRRATTTRTWDDGETTTHYWVEIPSEPDCWLEFESLPDSGDGDQVQTVADGRESMTTGSRTMPMRATTRYLQMFADTIKITD